MAAFTGSALLMMVVVAWLEVAEDEGRYRECNDCNRQRVWENHGNKRLSKVSSPRKECVYIGGVY